MIHEIVDPGICSIYGDMVFKVFVDCGFGDYFEYEGLEPYEAIEIARKNSGNKNIDVFVEWENGFGLKGYMNPNGELSLVGENWTLT